MFLYWLYSYLNDRQQYVKIGASKSEPFKVLSGVGQDTILGSLLFNIFFDDSNLDLPDVHNSNFADDKKFAVEIKKPSDTHKLQTAIDQFVAWCNDNDLDINFSKCKLFTLYMKQKPIIQDYTINNQNIVRVNEIRDLGIILDRKLSFDSHIEYICNKANAALQFVKRL